MSEQFEKFNFTEKNERLKSREVFTDDFDVIGPDDEIDCLEALPVSCAVMTIAKPEQNIAGMSHFSLGLNKEGVGDLVNQFQNKLKKFGLNISDCKIRFFNAGDILSAEIKSSLPFHNIELPPSEWMEAEGIRINKNTGEVTFFSLIESK